MRATLPLILALICTLAACDRQPASLDAPSASALAPLVSAETSAAATGEESGPTEAAAEIPVLGKTDLKPETARLHTPRPGSPDRVALMDSLREVVRPAIGGEIVFVVRELRTDGVWAFAVLEPTRPDGRPISVRDTPLYRRSHPDLLDGLRTEAIWRRDSEGWRVQAHAIGATDVWWTDHCGRVPRGVLTGC